jgi:hypothetical protein
MSAQEYLDKLAAEHKAAIDAFRAEKETKEQERTDEFRREYNIILGKMPMELSEFYSFDPIDPVCPLKISIPQHADIHVGLWAGTPRYKCATNRASEMPLSAAIDLAKQYYHEWQPEPELEAETAPAPQPTDPSLLEQANMALESFNYQRAIALALVEVAHQLSEINKTLVSMNSL